MMRILHLLRTVLGIAVTAQTQLRAIAAVALLVGVAVIVGGCMLGGDSSQSMRSGVFSATRNTPSQATVNETFTIEVTVTTQETLPALIVEENFDGLSLVDWDQGGFDLMREGEGGSTLEAIMLNPSAGSSATLSYTARCSDPITYTVTAIVRSRDIEPLVKTSEIDCNEG